MSSLAAARADNFYIPNNFDPNRPSRAPRPDNMKKDYSLHVGIHFEVVNYSQKLGDNGLSY